LATLQGIFLFEYFALYRSRSVGIHCSPQFSAMLMSVSDTQYLIHYQANNIQLSQSLLGGQDPKSALETISPHCSPEARNAAYEQWIELESRNRVLLASLILDRQRHIFFDQQPQSLQSVETMIPLPCSYNTWVETDFYRWYALAAGKVEDTSQITRFQRSLATLLTFANISPSSYSLIPIYPDPFLHLARYTPVSSLIVVAASSWLFARKVTLGSWTASRDYLRSWITSPDAAIATWWAGKVLRTYLAKQAISSNGTISLSTGLEENWCLYLSALVLWAFTYPDIPTAATPHDASHSSVSGVPGSIVLPSRSQTHPMSINTVPRQNTHLRPPVRALSTGRQTLPRANSPASSASSISITRGSSPVRISTSSIAVQYTAMQSFLTRMDTNSWQEMYAFRSNGNIEPVLEGVRFALSKDGGATGDKGALISEAVRILERLIEGRGIRW
jgi:hypothetical protein